MATFYENSLIHKGCHLPLWCCFGIVWNYSMYGNVDKVRSEILDYEFITNHNLRWNNVNQSGLLLNTSRFPSSATDLSLLNKPQKTPQTCSSSGFRFWNLSTLWHISLVTTASTYSTVCLWLRCIMVVYRATGEEIVELYRPDTGPFDSDEVKPVSDWRYGESTLPTSSHRCVGIPPCDLTENTAVPETTKTWCWAQCAGQTCQSHTVRHYIP